jgi:hypothetical protein
MEDRTDTFEQPPPLTLYSLKDVYKTDITYGGIK